MIRERSLLAAGSRESHGPRLTEPSTPAAVQPRSRSFARSDRQFAWLLLSPSLLVVVLVTVFPIAQAVQLSFSRSAGFEAGEFVGLENYERFFADPLTMTNLWTTAVFAVASLVITLPLSIGLALLLNQRFPGRAVVRTLLIMPWIISQLLAALMWRWVASADIGPLGYLLATMTGERIDLFGGTTSAMAGIILANVWRTFPYAMIIVLAALQSIPVEVYEAGKVDGAGAFQRLRYLTLPLIQGPLLIATIILSINAVNMVELPLILTGGGPLNATDLLGLRVYREAFQFQNFGLASAAALVMFAANILFSLVYIKVLKGEKG